MSVVTRDLTKGGEAEIRYLCAECGELNEEEGDTLYECGECGVFTRSNSADGDSHRCPDCNRFGSKVADASCASCEEGAVEEVEVYRCEACDEDVPEESAAAHECEETEGEAAARDLVDSLRVGDQVRLDTDEVAEVLEPIDDKGFIRIRYVGSHIPAVIGTEDVVVAEEIVRRLSEAPRPKSG